MNDKMQIEFQQNVASDLLEKLFPIDPFCIVAGGAPRDWYFEKAATDIDIFLHIKEGVQMSNTKKMLELALDAKISEAQVGHNIPVWYKMNPELRCVFNFKSKGVKIQIMVMRSGTHNSVIPNFPLSICHAWFKNGAIKLEKPFLRSVLHNAIYKTSEIYNDEHAYIEKILAKFPQMKYYSGVEELAESLLDV